MKLLRRSLMSWIMLLPFVFAVVYVLVFADAWLARARVFPLYVGLVGLGLGVAELVVSYVRSSPRPGNGTSARVLDTSFETDLPAAVVSRRSSAILLWLLGLLLGCRLIGFHLAVPAFLALYFRCHGRRNWWTNTLLIAGMWVLIFVVLDTVLRVPWPQPLLQQWYAMLF